MKSVVYRENERGKGDYGWLSTRYSFSFADWYDETKMGFGALRVLNDDVVAGGRGFGMHGHRDMEIITIVMEGTVRHEDNMGNSYVVKKGEVQVMSAGTGVMHSEINNSEDESLTLFQLWIEPREYSTDPRYEQKVFNFLATSNTIIPLVNKGGLFINQDAVISYGALLEGKELSYELYDKEHGVYLFIINGEVEVAGEILLERDAMSIVDVNSITISTKSQASFLLIEVPVR